MAKPVSGPELRVRQERACAISASAGVGRAATGSPTSVSIGSSSPYAEHPARSTPASWAKYRSARVCLRDEDRGRFTGERVSDTFVPGGLIPGATARSRVHPGRPMGGWFRSDAIWDVAGLSFPPTFTIDDAAVAYYARQLRAR